MPAYATSVEGAANRALVRLRLLRLVCGAYHRAVVVGPDLGVRISVRLRLLVVHDYSP